MRREPKWQERVGIFKKHYGAELLHGDVVFALEVALTLLSETLEKESWVAPAEIVDVCEKFTRCFQVWTSADGLRPGACKYFAALFLGIVGNFFPLLSQHDNLDSDGPKIPVPDKCDRKQVAAAMNDS